MICRDEIWQCADQPPTQSPQDVTAGMETALEPASGGRVRPLTRGETVNL